MKYLILTFILLMNGTQIRAGNDSGSGGDTYGKEFEIIANELLKVMKINKDSPIIKRHKIDLHLLELEISRTVIRTAEKVFLDGKEVDASKYTPTDYIAGIINLSRERWRKKNLLKRIELVAHEYMGILKLERNNYEVSIDLTEFILITHEKIKNNPLLKVNLYYGNRKHISSMISMHSRSVICDETLDEYLMMVRQAEDEALNNCQAYKSNCKVIGYETDAVISLESPGFRYCDITVIAK